MLEVLIDFFVDGLALRREGMLIDTVECALGLPAAALHGVEVRHASRPMTEALRWRRSWNRMCGSPAFSITRWKRVVTALPKRVSM
jgi:hypothetical protein